MLPVFVTQTHPSPDPSPWWLNAAVAVPAACGCDGWRSSLVRSHVAYLNSSFGGGADHTAQQPSVLWALSAPSWAWYTLHNSPPWSLKVQRTFACTVFTIQQACGKAARKLLEPKSFYEVGLRLRLRLQTPFPSFSPGDTVCTTCLIPRRPPNTTAPSVSLTQVHSLFTLCNLSNHPHTHTHTYTHTHTHTYLHTHTYERHLRWRINHKINKWLTAAAKLTSFGFFFFFAVERSKKKRKRKKLQRDGKWVKIEKLHFDNSLRRHVDHVPVHLWGLCLVAMIYSHINWAK